MKASSCKAGIAAGKADLPLHQRWPLRVLSLAVVLLCGGWFLYALWRQGPDLLALLQKPGLVILLPVLMVLLQSGMFLTGFAFHILIRAMGQPSRLSEAIWILMLSQFGKYLPGNVAHHLARVGLSRSRGCAVPSAALAIAIELAMSLLVAAVIGAGFILTAPETLQNSLYPWLPTIGTTRSAALMLGGVLAAAGIGAWWLWRARQRQPLPHMRAIAATLGIAAANFAVLGLAMSLVLQVVAPGASLPFLFLTAAYACAWILGTMTPGAPGGIGVREAILVLLLAPFCGESAAIAAALTLRIATTLADLLSFLLGLAWRHLALRAARREIENRDVLP